ncbi:MAG: LacI family DNA-binding transcriptional regulator [Pyrinomonas methylaliphatogenes]|nr:LacI family DNA-binding transcriptional regulator [Pyrinomonas methylaliphatogenes]
MPTTLADIAAALGVSKMTVSRAIRNHPSVNPETRERVLEMARRMNYRPNQHARALATNRSYLIGFIAPDLMHSYFAEIAKAVEAVVRPAGYEILICNTEEDAEKEIAEVEALRHRTDGLIIASALPPQRVKEYRRWIREGAKIVLIDRRFQNLKCTAVITDDVRVGSMATEHLIALGHRRIGHLRGPAVSTAEERFLGYRQALAKHRIRFDEKLVRACGFFEDQGYEAMRAWIEEGDLPSAIFATNDPVAIGAMRALEEAGIRVPDDISLVGAGDIRYADLLRVPLTTVSWARTEMGRQAAQLLIEMFEDGVGLKQREVRVEPRLIVRQSCAPFDPKRSRVALRSAD